jgi:hypothetical protein
MQLPVANTGFVIQVYDFIEVNIWGLRDQPSAAARVIADGGAACVCYSVRPFSGTRAVHCSARHREADDSSVLNDSLQHWQ